MNQSSMRTDSGVTNGPIPIPRRRQVAQNLFRLFSIKAGMRVVTCESSLEIDALIAAEANPDFTWLCDQPLRINHPFGKRPQYTFDLAMRNRAGEVCYYEVKPTDQLVEANDGELKPAHWDQLESICQELGYAIGFITEADLNPMKTLIANWRKLLPFAVRAYGDPDSELAAHLLNLASRGNGRSLRDLCLSEPNQDDDTVISHAAMLLHTGQLSAPLGNEGFTMSTKLQGADVETP